MVSDSELVEQLREVLRTADLTTTTTAIVRRKLEEHFDVELSEKKAFIREQVDLYLQSELQPEKGAEEEGEGKEEEEEGPEEGGEGNGESGEEEEVDGEEGEEEDEDREGTGNDRGSGKKASNKLNKDVKKRGGGGGFTKLCSLSPQLQKFVGESELARTQVVKQIWAYIREHNLQDPSNKRKILCDEKLYDLLNVKTIDMFQMNKVLSKHIWPLDSENAGPSHSAKPKEREKQHKKEREEEDEPPQKEKRRKTGSSGFLAPLPLSDALVNFLGTGESALSRADVVKRMWDYIKQNNLQDPSDKRRIICDEKLKELFEVDSFNGFTVAKLLAAHFVKTEQ